MQTSKQRGSPASPCISVCTLDDNDRCLGCGRTLEEIARWATMPAEQQWQIVDRLTTRRTG